MTRTDWIALGFIALAALLGLRKGLVGSALSLVGIAVGAVLGARIAPSLLGGDDSPYTPVVALGGAAVGALVLETVGTMVGNSVRRSLRLLPPLRALDSVGGLAVGAAAGVAIVWVLGAVALHLPGQTQLRRQVQQSTVLQRLNALVPPARLMEAIERVDPFPAIVGPLAPVEAPDPRLLQRPGVRAAAPSVVRVLGIACGLSVSGSGWVAAPRLVVTAAHVVAGQDSTIVEVGGSIFRTRAVAFDVRNDVAVLRASRPFGVRSLRLAAAKPGTAVAILGYPGNGAFNAAPGRIGRTTTVVSDDAYGRGPVTRAITSLGGQIRHGNSGGPAVNAAGRVESTVFAARVGSSGGFGVPPNLVRRALDGARGPVSTRTCTR